MPLLPALWSLAHARSRRMHRKNMYHISLTVGRWSPVACIQIGTSNAFHATAKAKRVSSTCSRHPLCARNISARERRANAKRLIRLPDNSHSGRQMQLSTTTTAAMMRDPQNVVYCLDHHLVCACANELEATTDHHCFDHSRTLFS